jgi:hypothetical protein
VLRLGSGKTNVSSLSQPAIPGQIDYFVSHSWHDEASTKFEQWELVTVFLMSPMHFVLLIQYCSYIQIFEEFRQTHKREPKVWLDEIIINQADIEESLRCLPVYLMGCKQVLVMCGDTYTDRLWCIWELYIAFRFVFIPLVKITSCSSHPFSEAIVFS